MTGSKVHRLIHTWKAGGVFTRPNVTSVTMSTKAGRVTQGHMAVSGTQPGCKAKGDLHRAGRIEQALGAHKLQV